MAEFKEKLFDVATYLFTGVGIVANWESFEKFILFVRGCILLTLQIRLHVLKVRNERKDKNR